jgi:2-methylcitrate dehydratase PrpD
MLDVPGAEPRDASLAPTAAFAGFAAGIDHQQLPTETAETAKRLLLDGIGCLLNGTQGNPGRIAWRTIERFGYSDGPSTAIISGEKISPRDAAFVNGITLYSVGVNDIHKESYSHPGGCIVPTLLSVGEWQNSPGPEIIAAMAAGYEVMGRLGRATIPGHWDRGFHPTGTFGPFGATAAAGRLLGLDAGQMTNALGIAGSQSSGLKAFQSDGSLTMVFHAGRSAQNGVEAAVLAQEGFTGPRAVFEDRQGFILTTGGGTIASLTEGLGESFEIDATTFRPYYGCTLTITASGAAAEIMKRRPGRTAADVSEITVRCHPQVIEDVGNADPRTLLAARLSIQFNIALVLHRGDVVIGDIGERELLDPAIRRLLPLVKFQADSSVENWGCYLDVGFKDGSHEEASMLNPKGDPKNPMTWDDTIKKFLGMVSPLDRPTQAMKVVEIVRHLERYRGTALVAAIAEAAVTPRVLN